MVGVPSTTWQMLEQRTSGEPLPKGLDAVWNAGVGFVDGFVPRYRGFIRRVEKILSLEKHFSEMTDSKLRDVASEFDPSEVKKFVLLEDACSNVTGFEQLGIDFVDEMVGLGMRVSTTDKFFN